MKKQFEEWISLNRNRILNEFLSFLKINTVTPNESDAFNFVEKYLDGIGFIAEKNFVPADLKEHKMFTNTKESCINPDCFNIKARSKRKVENPRKKVIFNIHVDVVPGSCDFKEAFDPVIRDGNVFGRGACDTKNNLIMLCEAIRFLNENNIEIQKDIEMDLVIEEEVSGNGTLSAILNGVDADLVIVMEPTNLLIYRGHRGCVTATIDVKGKSVHMGSNDTGISAIECAYHIINRLKEFEAFLLDEAKKDKDFSVWEKPLQINIGRIKGGEWPGTVAERCRITCNIGFLPNYTLETIKNSISDICKDTGDKWTNNNVQVTFDGLKNSAYIIDEKDINITEFLKIINKYGMEQRNSYGWRVSCDAHLYSKLAKVPTLIFGSGNLADAHSAHEKIAISELELGILMLAEYLAKQ